MYCMLRCVKLSVYFRYSLFRFDLVKCAVQELLFQAKHHKTGLAIGLPNDVCWAVVLIPTNPSLNNSFLTKIH